MLLGTVSLCILSFAVNCWSLADQIHYYAGKPFIRLKLENHMRNRQEDIPVHASFPYHSFPSQLLLHELVRCSGNEADIESPSQVESITPPYIFPVGRSL